MHFQVGDIARTKVSVGIFEQGQVGVVDAVTDGEILFAAESGHRQWLPEDNLELSVVPQDSPPFHPVLVAVGVAIAAAVVIAVFQAVLVYFGVSC